MSTFDENMLKKLEELSNPNSSSASTDKIIQLSDETFEQSLGKEALSAFLMKEDNSAPKVNKVLGFLDKVDSTLDNLTIYLDKIFYNILNCPQKMVDYACETASNWISYKLECLTVDIVNSVGPARKGAEAVLSKYGPLVLAISSATAMSVTPAAIVGVVIAIIAVLKHLYDLYAKPVVEATKFIKSLTERLISITSKMQKLANYQPPKSADINFDKFKIKYQPFSIEDIMAGTTLPYPDKPEPVKPPYQFKKKSTSS